MQATAFNKNNHWTSFLLKDFIYFPMFNEYKSGNCKKIQAISK